MYKKPVFTEGNSTRNLQAGQEIINIKIGQSQTRTFDMKSSGRAGNHQDESGTYDIRQEPLFFYHQDVCKSFSQAWTFSHFTGKDSFLLPFVVLVF